MRRPTFLVVSSVKAERAASAAKASTARTRSLFMEPDDAIRAGSMATGQARAPILLTAPIALHCRGRSRQRPRQPFLFLDADRAQVQDQRIVGDARDHRRLTRPHPRGGLGCGMAPMT